MLEVKRSFVGVKGSEGEWVLKGVTADSVYTLNKVCAFERTESQFV